MTNQKEIHVAVVGNPNSGKSTLINAIAGSRLRVGNWPGVTVEKKEAILKHNDITIRFIDLPGSYSLNPYSQEEAITRDFLINQKPDLIVNVVDSTNLERNVYLTIQLLELDIPVLMALNMHDEAENKGYEIDIQGIEKLLGIVVVPTVSTKKIGIDNLIDIIAKQTNKKPKKLFYGDDLEKAISQIETKIKQLNLAELEKYPTRFLAIKLLESDKFISEKINNEQIKEFVLKAANHLLADHDDDIETQIVDERYALASGLTQQVLKKQKIRKQEFTEKIDKVFLNKYLGLPIFFAMMWLTFKLTFDIGNPFVDWVDGLISGPVMNQMASLLNFLNAPEWFSSLVMDGILAGVGGVLVFVPIIATMMFFITFLESSGYMSRAAFIMDKAMHKIGLHGKAFIPLLLGFGCNVPSIYATRILETKRDKLLTALLVPLVSCGARLPVYVLFVAVFFRQQAGLVIWSIYLLGIAFIMLMGFIFKNTLFKAENPVFIMELPPYRMPSFKNLMVHTWEKVKHFIIKAGTLILAMSILVWFALNMPYGVEKKDSLLGKTGQAIAPVLKPIGFGTWEAGASLLTGFVAKEVVVSTMSEIYANSYTSSDEEVKVASIQEDLWEILSSFFLAIKDAVFNVFTTIDITGISAADDIAEEIEDVDSLSAKLQESFTPLSAYSFMVFILLYVPCLVVLAAIKHEFDSWGWVAFVVVYLTTLAWLASFVVYQGGRLLGFS